MAKQLLKKIYLPEFVQIRTLIKKIAIPGGIQYPGFKYYPRYPDFKDPPYEPSKLFFVTRIKPMKSRNCIEKDILQKFNLDGHKKHGGHKTILKNIPEVNELLWKIKHLVRIVPIQYSDELPKEISIGSSYLHDNGKFEITPRIKVAEERVNLTEKFKNDPKKMDSVLLKKHMRDRWLNPYEGTINEQ